jgi:hypothetical protein
MQERSVRRCCCCLQNIRVIQDHRENRCRAGKGFPFKLEVHCAQWFVAIGKKCGLEILIHVISGAGYDQIDIDACTKKGIRVSNVPEAVDDSTADMNMVSRHESIRLPLANFP